MGLSIKLDISLNKEWSLDKINWKKIVMITAIVLSSVGLAGLSGALLSMVLG